MVFKRWIVLVIVASCASTWLDLRADKVPQELFREAAAQYQAESWQAAADSFAAYLAQSPPGLGEDVPTARFYQAEARVQLEQYAEAQQLFQQFLTGGSTSDRNLARAEFQIGKTAWMLGQYELARERLTAFAAQHPAHPLAPVAKQHLAEMIEPLLFDADPLLAADQLLSQGQIEPALRAYLRIGTLERQSPRAKQARLSAARCYELLGEPHEATEIRQRCEQGVETSVATADKPAESQFH